MGNLISREDVIEEYIVNFGLTIEDIERIPAVDAEPRKHGKWIDMQYPLAGHTFISCSECGERLDIDSSYKSIINYCPNCGSKMDEVEE